ncbi:MAG: hypothetical protein AAGN35_10930, partial [Bacteroidota bacterium]
MKQFSSVCGGTKLLHLHPANDNETDPRNAHPYQPGGSRNAAHPFFPYRNLCENDRRRTTRLTDKLPNAIRNHTTALSAVNHFGPFTKKLLDTLIHRKPGPEYSPVP